MKSTAVAPLRACIDFGSAFFQDGYHFLVDRRCALLSAPLRSTLGDGSGKTVDVGKDSATKGTITMDDGQPPPTTTAHADPEGYVNPFAVDSSESRQGLGGDGDDQMGLNALNGGFAESRSNRITLPNMRGIVLEKVIEYLCWYGKYQNAKDVDIPKFEPRIMPEIALEL